MLLPDAPYVFGEPTGRNGYRRRPWNVWLFTYLLHDMRFCLCHPRSPACFQCTKVLPFTAAKGAVPLKSDFQTNFLFRYREPMDFRAVTAPFSRVTIPRNHLSECRSGLPASAPASDSVGRTLLPGVRFHFMPGCSFPLLRFFGPTFCGGGDS